MDTENIFFIGVFIGAIITYAVIILLDLFSSSKIKKKKFKIGDFVTIKETTYRRDVNSGPNYIWCIINIIGDDIFGYKYDLNRIDETLECTVEVYNIKEEDLKHA